MDFIIGKSKILLTNDIIKNDIFNDVTKTLSAAIIFLVALGFVIFTFVIYFKDKKERDKVTVIILLIALIAVSIQFCRYSYKSAIMIYAYNNNWYVETDTIIISKTETLTSYDTGGNGMRTKHFVYLEKYGKIELSGFIENFYSRHSGDSVYIILYKGIFGDTYAFSTIYPLKEYEYN